MGKLSDFEEIHDKGYEASSSSMDRTEVSCTETASSGSVTSPDSFRHSRTNSEVSVMTDYGGCLQETPTPRWPVGKCSNLSRLGLTRVGNGVESANLEAEMMKERFSKLLLCEDMSGGGKGVSTAVTISNAITNLYASVFGHHLKLEPLNHEKKSMWKREMGCLLAVCDYIVELVPTSQNLKDGSAIEVMSSRPRSDIYMNLPALRKLDMMLLDVLDSFEGAEFWYEEQGSMSGKSNRSGSFRRIVRPKCKEEKWWLPVPCVPPSGLSEKQKKHLRSKRDCAYQIHKASMAINASILSEMKVPHSYTASLPKSGKSSIGDTIYRYMTTADKFSPEDLLDCLALSSDHEALELADKVEASMYIWRRKACASHNKTSWNTVKQIISENGRRDKNHSLAERAELLLFCLKQKYPELSQTTLDTCKIEYNVDLGQAILESYSRVLEGLAFNTVAWIDDVLYVDKTTKTGDQ